MKRAAASLTEVKGSGGSAWSLFILPDTSIAISTSVGTSQERRVVAIGSGQVKKSSRSLRGAKLSTKVRDEANAVPSALKIVATTSTSLTSSSSLFRKVASSLGRASAPKSSRLTTENCSLPAVAGCQTSTGSISRKVLVGIREPVAMRPSKIGYSPSGGRIVVPVTSFITPAASSRVNLYLISGEAASRLVFST